MTRIKDTKSLTRDSRYELLRIAAMLMIIAFHICDHALLPQLKSQSGLYLASEIPFRLLIPSTFMPFGQVGVDLFFMISGYFMASRKSVAAGRVGVKLMSQMLFCTVLLIPVSWAIVNPETGFHFKIMDIKVFTDSWWFVGCYFLLIVMAKLFLNRRFQEMTENQCAECLIIIFGLFSIGWIRGILNSVHEELSMVPVAVFCYVLGGCVRKYNWFSSVRSWIFAATIVAAEIFVWSGQLGNMRLSLEGCLRDGATDKFAWSLVTYPKAGASIVILVIAVSLFELFRRIPFFYSKSINFLGSATFMMYLVHENNFARSVYRSRNWAVLLKESKADFLVWMVVYTIGIAAAGLLFYAIYCGGCRTLKIMKKMAVRTEGL